MFVRIPSDVPVDRPSVKAMRVACGSQTSVPIKPYVYRGLGYDLFEAPPLPPRPKPAPKPKPKPKRRKRKPRPTFTYVRPDEPVCQHVPPSIPREPEPGYQTGDGNDGSVIRPLKPRPPRQVSRNLRPSPEWSPMTGADIDDLLEDL